MSKASKQEEEKRKKESVVYQYYRKISRIVEYYILFCFIVIMILPLFNYSWVPPVVRIIYFTGFPLLLIMLIVSLFKDSLLHFLEKRFATKAVSEQTKTTQKKPRK